MLICIVSAVHAEQNTFRALAGHELDEADEDSLAHALQGIHPRSVLEIG